MRSEAVVVWGLVLAVGMSSATVLAAKSDKSGGEEAKSQKSSPKLGPTVTLKGEPLRVEANLKGVFEATEKKEIVLRPKVWVNFEVVRAVEHGAKVKQGDVLIQFRLEEYEQELAQMRLHRALSDLRFQQVQENLKTLKATVPLDLEAVRRGKRIAHEDLDYFLKVKRSMVEKIARFSLQMEEQGVDYAKEELRQLEKMYKADDLTEETEAIVLKRARNQVQAGEFGLAMQRILCDEFLKVLLPRAEIEIKDGVVHRDLAAGKAEVLLPLSLREAQREMDKLVLERTQEEEKLKKFTADREWLTVKAPCDGIVYYGQFHRGKWSGADSHLENLRPGGNVPKNNVVMTILDPERLGVRVTVNEGALQDIHAGQKGSVRPTGYPQTKLRGVVEQVDTIPSAVDSIEAWMRVKLPEDSPLRPGMTCSVKLLVHLEKEALMVPAKAVADDKLREDKKYVMRVTERGKAKKRYVTVGRKLEDRVQILDGLDEGDRILAEASVDKPGETSKDSLGDLLKSATSKEEGKDKEDEEKDKVKKAGSTKKSRSKHEEE